MIAVLPRVVSRAGGEGACEGFADIAALAHAGDPRWIPEDPAAVQRAFSARNPWFQTGQAATFAVPERARVATFFTPPGVIDGAVSAFFGFFAAVHDDEDAARAVLAEAAAWARARGAQVIYGPIDFATSFAYRVLTQLEEGGLPFVGEPYNPPYYPRLLEAAGCTVAQRYVTYQTTQEEYEKTLEHGQAPRAALLAAGYRFEALTPERWMSSIDLLHAVADDIFGGNFGYTPISRAQFGEALGERFARKLDPDASQLAIAPDGSIAGLTMFYPHWGPIIVAGAHARVALAELDFATHFPQLHAAGPVEGVFKTVGVSRAHRRKGIGEALSTATLERAITRYPRICGALMREDNLSRRIIRAHSSERWYALYSKPLS